MSSGNKPPHKTSASNAGFSFSETTPLDNNHRTIVAQPCEKPNKTTRTDGDIWLLKWSKTIVKYAE